LVFVHPECVPAFGFCEIGSVATFVEIDRTLVPVQDAEIAAAAIHFKPGLLKESEKSLLRSKMIVF
jgi:hypothetical protein